MRRRRSRRWAAAVDGDWDEFVNGLNDIGLDKVLEMTTVAYQRQYR